MQILVYQILGLPHFGWDSTWVVVFKQLGAAGILDGQEDDRKYCYKALIAAVTEIAD